MPYEELSLDLLPPGQMTAPEVVGGTVEGGRSLNGFGPVADISGGGYVSVKYGNLVLQKYDYPDRYRYYQRMAAFLAGGRRSILVPLLTDFTAPLFAGDKLFPSLPHSDLMFFSDGTGYAQNPIVATVSADAALNAGTLEITIERGGTLFGGEWFEIAHATKSSRAYVITEIDSVVGSVYTVAIRPTLREAVTAGTSVNFRRPRCLMRVSGRMPLEVSASPSPWHARPEISFIEAFP